MQNEDLSFPRSLHPLYTGMAGSELRTFGPPMGILPDLGF